MSIIPSSLRGRSNSDFSGNAHSRARRNRLYSTSGADREAGREARGGDRLKAVCVRLLAALVLCGCAGEPAAVPVVKWAKPGGSAPQFIAVREECLRFVRKQSAAFYVAGERDPGSQGLFGGLLTDIGADFGHPAPIVGLDPELFRRCMNGHGWSADPGGFGPPEGEEVEFAR